MGFCHDDDLYMRRYRLFDSQVNKGGLNFRVWSAPFPASKLFITSAQFDQLFGRGVSADRRPKNLDWRGLELYLENLPYFFLTMYCTDTEKGTNSVAQFFSNRYSKADLKAAGLWQRLADKLTSVGGCDLYY